MSNKLQYNNCEIRFGSLDKSGFEQILTDNYTQAKKIIITDENVFGLWMESILTRFPSLANAEIIQLPPGEENKNIEICTHVWNALSEYEITRKDLIINIGGGVITDMGGFIASTFKRGLSFINVPTTLLSQVDASIGGKTGIDLGPFKNQIGVFADPDYVFIDDAFLSTLADEEFQSGCAEMFKHGLISDAKYWDQIKNTLSELKKDILPFIEQSVGLKKAVVEKDPNEKGLRKILNFGHTIGHAIEGFLLEKEKTVPHGFAVAWGMIAESRISLKLGMISEKDFKDIYDTLNDIYQKPDITESDIPAILNLMQNDKKNEAGKIKFSLLDEIGRGCFDAEVEHDVIEEVLRLLV